MRRGCVKTHSGHVRERKSGTPHWPLAGALCARADFQPLPNNTNEALELHVLWQGTRESQMSFPQNYIKLPIGCGFQHGRGCFHVPMLIVAAVAWGAVGRKQG